MTKPRYRIFGRDHGYMIQVMTGAVKDEFTRWLIRTATSLRAGDHYPLIYYIVNNDLL